DTGRQVEAMEPAIARLHRDGNFRIFVDFGERLALIGLPHRPERHPETAENGRDSVPDVPEPLPHSDPRCLLSVLQGTADLTASLYPASGAPASIGISTSPKL